MTIMYILFLLTKPKDGIQIPKLLAPLLKIIILIGFILSVITDILILHFLI